MTSMNEPACTGIIKADTRGRIRYTAQFKEESLEAFGKSGLSGMQFARQCGVSYPTFAAWVKKHKETRGEGARTDKVGNFSHIWSGFGKEQPERDNEREATGRARELRADHPI